MHKKRCLSWTAALRDIRSDRVRLAPGIISARSLIQGLVRIRRTSLVTPTGAFDRRSIMRVAVVAAKAYRRRTGATWVISMSVALSAAWQAAKTARQSASVRKAAPVVCDKEGQSYIASPVQPDAAHNAAAANRAGYPRLLTRSAPEPSARSLRRSFE